MRVNHRDTYIELEIFQTTKNNHIYIIIYIYDRFVYIIYNLTIFIYISLISIFKLRLFFQNFYVPFQFIISYIAKIVLNFH